MEPKFLLAPAPNGALPIPLTQQNLGQSALSLALQGRRVSWARVGLRNRQVITRPVTHVRQVRLGNSQRKLRAKLATDTLRFPEISLPGSPLVLAGATGTNGTGGPR